MQNKVKIFGYKYFESNVEDRVIIVFPSATLSYYHIIIDSAYQDNEYFHLTKNQLEKQFKIFTNDR